MIRGEEGGNSTDRGMDQADQGSNDSDEDKKNEGSFTRPNLISAR